MLVEFNSVLEENTQHLAIITGNHILCHIVSVRARLGHNFHAGVRTLGITVVEFNSVLEETPQHLAITGHNHVVSVRAMLGHNFHRPLGIILVIPIARIGLV